jgi:hypothetical protein
MKVVAVSLIVLVASLFPRVAAANSAPNSLSHPEIIPVYWNALGKTFSPEIQNVMPAFYADFAGYSFGYNFFPNGATQILAEYGVGTMSTDAAHVVTASLPLFPSTVVTYNNLSGMLQTEMTNGTLKKPTCSPPGSGTDAYANTLYVIHLPPSVNEEINAPGTCNFAGKHDVFTMTMSGPFGNYACHSAFLWVLDETSGNGNKCDQFIAGLTANGIYFGPINGYTYTHAYPVHALLRSSPVPLQSKQCPLSLAPNLGP